MKNIEFDITRAKYYGKGEEWENENKLLITENKYIWEVLLDGTIRYYGERLTIKKRNEK